MTKANIAIFIDAENIDSDHWPQIHAHALSIGTMQSCRIFGDFTENRLAKWLKVARSEGLSVDMQMSDGKNGGDIAMTVAAMDALHTARLEVVFLASSDRDFAPLARRLRAAGLNVFGFGIANTPESLRKACTKFVVLRPVKRKPAAAPDQIVVPITSRQ